MFKCVAAFDMVPHWATASSVPLTLFAIPDEANETNRYTNRH